MATSGSFGNVAIVDPATDVQGMTNLPTVDPGHRSPDRLEEGMNDPEVTMNNVPPSSNLIATRKALAAAGAAISLVKRVPAPLKSLADQVIRSAASVPANLEEGHGRLGRDRIHHWRIAFASAKEVDCHLRLLADSLVINRQQANDVLRLFDEVRAMTWRLLHPRR